MKNIRPTSCYQKQLVQQRERRETTVGRFARAWPTPFIAASLRNAPYGHSFTVLRGRCYVFTASFHEHAKGPRFWLRCLRVVRALASGRQVIGLKVKERTRNILLWNIVVVRAYKTINVSFNEEEMIELSFKFHRSKPREILGNFCLAKFFLWIVIVRMK